MWSVWQTWKMARRAAGFFGGLLVAVLLAAGPAAGAPFSDPMTLSNGGGATTPAVAVTSSGKVYVAWVEGGKIFFKRSKTPTAQGSCGGSAALEFEAPVPLSDGTGMASLPAVAGNGSGGVFVAWQVDAWPANPAIYFRRSLDGGANFQAPVKLSQDASSATFPSAAADNFGGVFVAWQDLNLSTSTSAVMVAQSTNGGETLPRATVFSIGGFGFFQPAVASDGSRVHVVWNDVSLLGVWYKGFDRGTDPSAASAQRLTTAVALYPRIGHHTGQVTAAWVELVGNKIKSRAMMSGQPFGAESEVYAFPGSMGSVSNLSLSLGDAGRFFGWQEADFGASTSAIRYLLGNGSAASLRSGGLDSNLAAPSVGQHGTDRLVASWQENGANFSPEVRLAHTGGSAAGTPMNAWVEMTPHTLNAKTMYQGAGVFTLRIQLPDGDPAAIDLGSLKLNGQPVVPLRTTVVDADGDGKSDTLEVKLQRSDLQPVFGTATLTAGQRNGNYTVTGTAGGGCFSGDGAVRIVQ